MLSDKGKSLSRICGIGSQNKLCDELGQTLSPDQGYTMPSGIQRVTGINIDQSGNVWITNNWKPQPTDLTNPGGDGILVFVGAAAPVERPLIGLPQEF